MLSENALQVGQVSNADMYSVGKKILNVISLGMFSPGSSDVIEISSF